MNSKEWVIVVSAIILVGIVSSVVSVGMTGNVVKVNNLISGQYPIYTTSETYSKTQVYSKTEVDSISNNLKSLIAALQGNVTQKTSITYLDPTKCHQKFVRYTSNMSSTYLMLDCGSNQVLAQTDFIFCGNKDKSDIAMYGFNSAPNYDYIPSVIGISCINSVTSQKYAPSLISGSCCEITNQIVKTAPIQKTVFINNSGAVSYS